MSLQAQSLGLGKLFYIPMKKLSGHEQPAVELRYMLGYNCMLSVFVVTRKIKETRKTRKIIAISLFHFTF